MRIRQALSQARQRLDANHVEAGLLEAELLLRHILGVDRTRLYLDLDVEFPAGAGESLERAVRRRLAGEPSAYITGHREFFGLDLLVNPGVLIPRPETELLVEQAIAIARESPVAGIADIGTGSGAVAIALATHLQGIPVYATDVSPAALDTARENAARHGVLERIHFLQGDLLAPLPPGIDLIAANLPYVRQSEISGTLLFEPRQALDGGPDGLDLIRRFCRQLPAAIAPGGKLLLEVGLGQSKGVRELLREIFPSARISITVDGAGIERVVSTYFGTY